MPNTNPAGPFQPMSQHLMPGNGLVTLGHDSNMLVDLTAGGHLLISPAAGVLRAVSPVGQIGFTVGPGAVPVTNTAIYLKAGTRRYIVDSKPLPIIAPRTDVFGNFSPMFLMEDDFEGLYFSFAGGDDRQVNAWASYYDTRNVVRFKAELTDTAFVPITPDAPVGMSTVLHQTLSTPGCAGGVFNFDGVPNDITFAVQTAEGQIIPLTDPLNIPASTNPGMDASLERLDELYPLFINGYVLPTGWRLMATLSNPVATVCEVWTYAAYTNQSDVRADQGGAY